MRSVDGVTRYPCEQCEYMATRKESLDQHKISVHEGIKYHCVQCGHQAISKSNLTQHKRSAHEGIEYPCRQREYQATTKKFKLVQKVSP